MNVITAIIGAGRMGRRHVAAARAAGCTVVGIADPSEAALRLAVSEAGLAEDECFREPCDMLRALRPELVIVASTAPFHHEGVLAAVDESARFVLCEKPMAVSLRQCDEMIAAASSRNVRLAVNHQMRYMEYYTFARELMASEDAGGLRSISVIAGNFGMAMNAVHYFEMLRVVSCDEPARVSAWFSDDAVPNPRGAQFEDRAGSIRITTRKGVRFYLEAGADQGHGVTAIYAGRNAVLMIDELAGTYRVTAREAEYREMPTTRYGMPAVVREGAIAPADVIAPTRATIEALLTGADFPSGEDGRRAQEILVAAHVSAEQGGVPVELADTAGLPRERVFAWA